MFVQELMTINVSSELILVENSHFEFSVCTRYKPVQMMQENMHS